jgi:hypothetical protein
MGTWWLVVATTMVWVATTEPIVIIVVAAKFMLWMLATEAVVIVVLASTITWIVATEAVLISVAANAMTRMRLAETTHAGRLLAKAMVFVPAAEATEVNVLKQRFGAASAIVVERRRRWRDRGRRHDDPRVRRSRVQGEHSQDDAVQQHAMGRSQRRHASSCG